ncbi:hypothetical protein [Amaricoccus sp.]|uniref:hypothetical protein n=1 Tax=Amaricoccus sp. TaxID=1872485 RepID=UPI001B4A5184|nr:hypothetical protein [Amaricoccus sp.]MBP7001810.1 hypothetical protein [Amaricoccus sp.]
MMDWRGQSDEQVFETGGEMPGLLNAYDRGLEISRRRFQLEKDVAAAQISAAKAQNLRPFGQ